MKVHIFRGPGRIFAVTKDGAGTNLPARYGPWTEFKSLEMMKGEAQPGVDGDECLDEKLRLPSFRRPRAHHRVGGKLIR
jgi:hypothetical protein